MSKRDQLFNELIAQIEIPSPLKTSLLFHHVYSLKLGDDFVFDSKEDLSELVQSLNTGEFNYENY